MVVAFAAGHGRSEPGGGGGAHAFRLVFGDVFGVLDAAFLGDLVEAVVGGGDLLWQGGIGQQVAGDLLDGELIEGLVGVEGVDDIVAIGRGGAFLVAVVADGVGIAHRIEPGHRHAFAEMGGGEQFVDDLTDSGLRVFRVGLLKCGHLRGRGRQAGDVEMETAQQGGGIRGW